MNSTELLLGDRLAPMTSSMGFVDAPLARVAERFTMWTAETKGVPGIDATTRTIGGSLDEVLHALLPLKTGEPNRFLLTADTRHADMLSR